MYKTDLEAAAAVLSEANTKNVTYEQAFENLNINEFGFDFSSIRNILEMRPHHKYYSSWKDELFHRLGLAFRSGLFFMIIGFLLILYAQNNQTVWHPIFSYVYVVLGIAVLLYGTGTQSAGSIKSELNKNWKFQGTLVGGAGVLAAMIGGSIIFFYDDMRESFSPGTKLIKVSLELKDGNFLNYQPDIDDYNLKIVHSTPPTHIAALPDGRYSIIVEYPNSTPPCGVYLDIILTNPDGYQGQIQKVYMPWISDSNSLCNEVRIGNSMFRITDSPKLVSSGGVGLETWRTSVFLSFSENNGDFG